MGVPVLLHRRMVTFAPTPASNCDPMLLTVDIGNTAIHLGLYDAGRLKRQVSIPTSLAHSAGKLRRALRWAGKADEALICSVVPWATPKITAGIRYASDARVRVVGRDVKVPLKNRYRYPKQVGQDRLVGAFAAVKEFRRDCIVCDFGTAVTIDVVTRNGEYLGGIISPGLELSLETLAARTALLPKVDLSHPAELLGRDTANSIRSGIVYGCAALCDGLTEKLKRKYAPRATVVATGGAAPLIARHAASINHLRPNLVLDGLFILMRNRS